eukprot:5492432-Amphidinium_carterae.1
MMLHTSCRRALHDCSNGIKWGWERCFPNSKETLSELYCGVGGYPHALGSAFQNFQLWLETVLEARSIEEGMEGEGLMAVITSQKLKSVSCQALVLTASFSYAQPANLSIPHPRKEGYSMHNSMILGCSFSVEATKDKYLLIASEQIPVPQTMYYHWDRHKRKSISMVSSGRLWTGLMQTHKKRLSKRSTRSDNKCQKYPNDPSKQPNELARHRRGETSRNYQ